MDILGLGLFLGRGPTEIKLPVLPQKAYTVQNQAPRPDQSIAALSGPWFRSPPRRINPPPTHPSLPPPPSTPPHIDKGSLSFLGSSLGNDGTPTYFFKDRQNGRIVILMVGETKKGWTLIAIDDHTFTLSGPGGLYEVAR